MVVAVVHDGEDSPATVNAGSKANENRSASCWRRSVVAMGGTRTMSCAASVAMYGRTSGPSNQNSGAQPGGEVRESIGVA